MTLDLDLIKSSFTPSILNFPPLEDLIFFEYPIHHLSRMFYKAYPQIVCPEMEIFILIKQRRIPFT